MRAYVFPLNIECCKGSRFTQINPYSDTAECDKCRLIAVLCRAVLCPCAVSLYSVVLFDAWLTQCEKGGGGAVPCMIFRKQRTAARVPCRA